MATGFQPPTELRHWHEYERTLWAAPAELRREVHREVAPESLYYMVRVLLTTRDIRDEVTGERQVEHPYVYEFCEDVQESSANVIDIAFRGGWKSTSKSFANPIRRVIRDPNVAICIFSFQRAMAKKHLSRVKQELEGNKELIATWPEIFYENPGSTQHGAKSWSLEAGLIVKRSTNRLEATISCSAFESSLPTGSHFDILIFDDIVDEDSCRTEEGRQKSKEQWQIALGLTNRGAEAWYQGTHYNAGDVWVWLNKKKGFVLRRRAAVDREKPAPAGEYEVAPGRSISYEIIGGAPVFLTAEELAQKAWEMGRKVYGQQMLVDPHAGEDTTFDATLVQYYRKAPGLEGRAKTRYLLIDPANRKHSTSDNSAFVVVALGSDRNVYVVDLWKGRLDPLERVLKAIELHRKWTPHETRWEQNGLESDVFWLRQEQEKVGYRFEAEGYAWRIDKVSRLHDSLAPLLERKRLWLPNELPQHVEGEWVDNVRLFVHEELARFPLTKEDHWLDALNLLFHPKAPDLLWPTAGPRRILGDSFADSGVAASGSWYSA